MKILMVCLGNICRSPMAEGILRAHAGETDIEVDSAGTSSFHIDEGPDPRAVLTVRKHGIDISSLRGRQFSEEDFDRFDKIYVMDQSNLRNVLALARDDADREKVALLLDEVPGFPEGSEIPDPYFGGDHGFVQVYQMLVEAAKAIVQKHHS